MVTESVTVPSRVWVAAATREKSCVVVVLSVITTPLAVAGLYPKAEAVTL